MTVHDLPTLNALLNASTAALLITGRIQIKRGRQQAHKRIMITAIVTSALFLTSYLIYHGQVGSVPYPHQGWTRPLYFAILIPHSILAAVMVPFIIAAVVFALRGRFEKHKRLVRWVWPVWIYVSLTGIVVYMMLYRL
jgi:putative membrane protein